MLTQGEGVEAHALRKRGWSVSAIARHMGRDRRTVRAYLNGERVPGQRKPSGPDTFVVFEEYCRIRLRQDPHLQVTTLLEELEGLGYGGGYSSLTRAVRVRGLRPHCEPCHQVKGRDVAVIDHEPGAETQWDWVHLPDPPKHWGWRREAYLLVGSLPYSGRWRGWLSASQDQPHLVEGLHQVADRLGGLTLGWRFDRMSTVFDHQAGDISASFAQVVKYYGVTAVVCPPRRGQRKGSVEKSNDMAAQRWWRTVPDEFTPERAQASLDSWCERTADLRVRWADGIKQSVATFARGEPLSALPAQFPAVLTVTRVVSPQALVSFDGNFYSVPPGHRGQEVRVSRVLGAETADITSSAGNTLARHRLEPKGAHAIVRAEAHVVALEKAVLTASGDLRGPCRRKQRIPPSADALAEAEQVRARLAGHPVPGETGPVVDFAAYAAASRPIRAGDLDSDDGQAAADS
jgi:transposase